MNKIIITGRLTREPEVRYTQNGKAVAGFTVAVDKYVGQGEKSADFIPVVAWDKLAEICGNNLGKGSKILVEGRLQIRDYETKEGQKRRIAEIVAQNVEFLEKKKEAAKPESGADSFGKEVFPDSVEVPF